jgi:hypothetical protein
MTRKLRRDRTITYTIPILEAKIEAKCEIAPMAGTLGKRLAKEDLELVCFEYLTSYTRSKNAWRK